MLLIIWLWFFLFLLILFKNYRTIRYNFMVLITKFKVIIKRNDKTICEVLLYINKNFIERFVSFLSTNFIVQELINTNKIPYKFVYMLKIILEYISKSILYIVYLLSKK